MVAWLQSLDFLDDLWVLWIFLGPWIDVEQNVFLLFITVLPFQLVFYVFVDMEFCTISCVPAAIWAKGGPKHTWNVFDSCISGLTLVCGENFEVLGHENQKKKINSDVTST